MQENWLIDPDYRKKFLDCCKYLAKTESFHQFRQDPYIKTVINNTGPEWLMRAVLHDRGLFDEKNLKSLSEIDKVGKADGFEIIKGIPVSPTTVRYFFAAVKIFDLFNYPTGLSIANIGDGFGGQSVILDNLYDGLKFTNYDLPEVQALQARYFEEFDIKAEFPTVIEERKFDLVIAWASWSELSNDLRQEYYDKIISKADRFFICSNWNVENDLKILESDGRKVEIFRSPLVEEAILFYDKTYESQS
jgi:hypothetical protein